jgi:Proliferating cell nuclear antigen, N-terminal domain
MCMRTSQTQQWRTLIDFLKDMVSECNITFGPDGMRLHSLDPVKAALVHLHAKSEFYYCKQIMAHVPGLQ